ncbi:MAG: hypothetical protein ACFFER_08460 [Candidatus Thorarchaeota archaeon]
MATRSPDPLEVAATKTESAANNVVYVLECGLNRFSNRKDPLDIDDLKRMIEASFILCHQAAEMGFKALATTRGHTLQRLTTASYYDAYKASKAKDMLDDASHRRVEYVNVIRNELQHKPTIPLLNFKDAFAYMLDILDIICSLFEKSKVFERSSLKLLDAVKSIESIRERLYSNVPSLFG